MSLFEHRAYFKPFKYDFAFEYYLRQNEMHWLVSEVPLSEDIVDWNSRLTPSERNLLTQLLRFFTQSDTNIAQGYIERFLPKFQHPEVRMMLLSFAAMEAVHQHAYSALIDTLGLPESDYKAFQNFKEMKDKHDFMFAESITKNIGDTLVDLATFAAFGEGLQLFSSFAVLLSFQKRGLLKGTTTLTEYSLRDESLHVEGMMKIFHTLLSEHPRAWTDEIKKRIYNTCRKIIEMEDAFIDLMFGMGDIEGISAKETKQYIRYIADRRLLQLGLKPNYRAKENPFPWLDWVTNSVVHANFFEARSTEYSRQEIEGWDNAFDTISPKEEEDVTPKTKSYHLYTMPGCPHCDRAKKLLTDDGLSFTFEQIDDAEERTNLKKTYNWKTFPMVFWVEGLDMFFVGGADALAERLKPEERKSA